MTSYVKCTKHTLLPRTLDGSRVFADGPRSQQNRFFDFWANTCSKGRDAKRQVEAWGPLFTVCVVRAAGIHAAKGERLQQCYKFLVKEFEDEDKLQMEWSTFVTSLPQCEYVASLGRSASSPHGLHDWLCAKVAKFNAPKLQGVPSNDYKWYTERVGTTRSAHFDDNDDEDGIDDGGGDDDYGECEDDEMSTAAVSSQTSTMLAPNPLRRLPAYSRRPTQAVTDRADGAPQPSELFALLQRGTALSLKLQGILGHRLLQSPVISTFTSSERDVAVAFTERTLRLVKTLHTLLDFDSRTRLTSDGGRAAATAEVASLLNGYEDTPSMTSPPPNKLTSFVHVDSHNQEHVCMSIEDAGAGANVVPGDDPASSPYKRLCTHHEALESAHLEAPGPMFVDTLAQKSCALKSSAPTPGAPSAALEGTAEHHVQPGT
jgi:hypothetical protein